MKTIENTKLIKKETKFFDLIPYIFCFFTFSFLGWIMETLFCYGLLGQFVKRGFLYSPICPIYGTGALILMIYLDKSKSNYAWSFDGVPEENSINLKFGDIVISNTWLDLH